MNSICESRNNFFPASSSDKGSTFSLSSWPGNICFIFLILLLSTPLTQTRKIGNYCLTSSETQSANQFHFLAPRIFPPTRKRIFLHFSSLFDHNPAWTDGRITPFWSWPCTGQGGAFLFGGGAGPCATITTKICCWHKILNKPLLHEHTLEQQLTTTVKSKLT